MPKLLQINVTANWGSTGRIAEECNKIAQSKGWKTYVAYGRNNNLSQSEIYRVDNKWEVYEHYMENRLFDNEGLASRLATKRLVRKINEIKPDIIHLHNIHDHYLNYRILFKYLNQTNIKIVYTFHDFWAITGGCAHFVGVNCLRWQTGCYNCPQRRNLIDCSKRNYKLKRKYIGGCKNMVITAVSEWVGVHIRQSFLKDKDIRIIPNGIDTKIFQPSDASNLLKSLAILDRIKDKFVIMGVSSQWRSASKGLDDYKALSKILQPNEVIVLVGIPDEVISELPKNIISVKRTNNQQELAMLYSRANVITSFSSAETFGLTIVEGYACGTPAVVYDNTAPPFLITPQTGFVAKNHDYKDAYAKILQIKENGKSYYYASCIKLAREKYDKERCFMEYLKLYNDLLKQKI
ncbi:glycosyltransferase [uncultured Bacteroides sp.]|uniref:glycosyltransferase n=1 Tax=uncultured Bacteroides sp. TaxID=162156 RepID=UPI0026762CCF|nr:glycosyltransferase [uncultured Bacteroides sp.]